MVDIEALLASGDSEKLKELKLFLFKENIRLKTEQNELEKERERLHKEQARFQKEMDMLSRKTALEQKRLKDETLFFEKKMEILKDAFLKLDQDRQRLKKERARFDVERDLWQGRSNAPGADSIASVLFRGVTNPLSLRKRYKDLLKIFHPDNLCGDSELVQIINREYERRKKAE